MATNKKFTFSGKQKASLNSKLDLLSLSRRALYRNDGSLRFGALNTAMLSKETGEGR